MKKIDDTRMNEKELNMSRLGLGRRKIDEYALFDVVLVDAIADLDPQELYVLVGCILETYEIQMPELRDLLRIIRGEEE